MAQLQSPETYADGQQVTAARLNNQTNGATLLPGAITDQTNITANTVASNDSVLLYDLSATALREANVSDVLGSNLPVTTSAVTAGANSDVVVTPNNGTIVTGQAYTSGDGLTVTVTSTAHVLVVGQVILVTAAATGYNGTFRVATVATNSFTYVMTTAATPGSSTLSYTKLGSVRNAGSESVAGSLFVAGNAVISGTTAIAGAATVAGATTLSGATTVSGALTASGTANFTGALQVNGTVGYVLTEIFEETMSPVAPAVGNNLVFTSTAFTKPADEIWVFEADFHISGVSGWGFAIGFRYGSATAYSGTYQYTRMWSVSGNTLGQVFHEVARWTAGTGTTFTAETVKADLRVSSGSLANAFVQTSSFISWTGFATTNVTPSKFRIYKYKTA